MTRIASFDLGTSQLKCVLVDGCQNVLYSASAPIESIHRGSFVEQDPDAWWDVFLRLSKSFDASSVDAIIFSGQMQDLILIDKDGRKCRDAILYSDHRGADYTECIPESIVKATSIAMDGTIPITKLLWMQEHEMEILSRARHLLISAKDYLVYRLTGVAASDVTSMSTSGLMDINSLCYTDTCGIVDESILPSILHADERVGDVNVECGYRLGTPVYAGAGDAGASTLASGVLGEDVFSVNLGTSGWISTASRSPKSGVFNLAAVNRGFYVNVIPVLNAGLVHSWVSSMHFPDDESHFVKTEELLGKDAGNRDLICLPYLSGERFPVSDEKVRGVYIGLDRSTLCQDLARSALEGVAFSLKSGMEDITPRRLSLVGGGARSAAWCRIFASVFNCPVRVYANSDTLSAIALSTAVLLDMGMVDGYGEVVERMLASHYRAEYLPDGKLVEHYRSLYERFKAVYPAVEKLF